MHCLAESLWCSLDMLQTNVTVPRRYVELSAHHVLVYGGQRSLDCLYSNRVDVLDLRNGQFLQLRPSVGVAGATSGVTPTSSVADRQRGGGAGSLLGNTEEHRHSDEGALDTDHHVDDDTDHADHVHDHVDAADSEVRDGDRAGTAQGGDSAAGIPFARMQVPSIAGACFAGFQTIGGLEIGLVKYVGGSVSIPLLVWVAVYAKRDTVQRDSMQKMSL